PARLPELRVPGLPHVQSRPAHRRFGEQLRLFPSVIIQNFFQSDLPDRGLLSPLSSRGLFAPADRKRPPVTRGPRAMIGYIQKRYAVACPANNQYVSPFASFPLRALTL